jgi:hypothetical protein
MSNVHKLVATGVLLSLWALLGRSSGSPSPVSIERRRQQGMGNIRSAAADRRVGCLRLRAVAPFPLLLLVASSARKKKKKKKPLPKTHPLCCWEYGRAALLDVIVFYECADGGRVVKREVQAVGPKHTRQRTAQPIDRSFKVGFGFGFGSSRSSLAELSSRPAEFTGCYSSWKGWVGRDVDKEVGDERRAYKYMVERGLRRTPRKPGEGLRWVTLAFVLSRVLPR